MLDWARPAAPTDPLRDGVRGPLREARLTQPLDPLLAGAYHLHGVAHQLRRRGEAGPLRGHERVALDGAADCAEIASHAVLLAHEAIRQ